MGACRTYQASYSHWRGGPPEWTEEDRAKALAYERWLAEACPQCGTRDDDWFDADGKPLAEPTWTPVARSCTGCEVRSAHTKAMPPKAKEIGAHSAWALTAEFDPNDEADLT